MRWISEESALLAWLGIVVFLTAYVVGYDMWASYTNHKMMTTAFRDWLADTVSGPIIAGLWIGLFVGLTWHFLFRGRA